MVRLFRILLEHRIYERPFVFRRVERPVAAVKLVPMKPEKIGNVVVQHLQHSEIRGDVPCPFAKQAELVCNRKATDPRIDDLHRGHFSGQQQQDAAE